MQTEWYRQNIEKIFDYFKTSRRGLTSDRVLENRKRFGQNILSDAKKRTIFDILLSQFNNPLIYVLVIADVVVFFLGHYTDGFIILFIITLNTIIGVFQEGKAENTLAALKRVVKTYATVWRNGREERIPDYEVVAGDILILGRGDPISADARIFENESLKVNEASLTGESESVNKISNPISSAGVKISDQNNMIFKGTYSVSGSAKAVVVKTGIKTVIGQISERLIGLDMDVPLKKNIANLSKLICYIVAIISVILFLFGITHGYGLKEMSVIIVAIVVSAIPESLPVVVTLVLATGVWRMSQRKVLVKRLQAVEALGQASVLALDKTGTITKNQMMVEKIFVGDCLFDVSGDGYDPRGSIKFEGKELRPQDNKDLDLLIRSAVFTAVAEIQYSNQGQDWELKNGDPTEAAILVLGKKFGYKKDELEINFPKILELPFELETKHHATINQVKGKNVLSVVGSPEVVLENSTKIWNNGRSKKMSKVDFQKIQTIINKLSGDDGYRVLAVGLNFNSPTNIDPHKLPKLTFLGLIAILDSIRPEVNESVELVKKAGMKVVMITGDYVETAKSIARRVGIYSDENLILTGKDVSEMSDDKLISLLDRVTVFARVTPKDKLRIIEVYKRKGERIAMTGDGVNDALSLISADLGISMGKIGTEVAREASDLVLMDDKFGNIVEAAEEGRNIYWSIRKSISYLLSSNIAELLVVAIAIIVQLPLPLLAAQIIWLNFVTDTFLVASIAFDPKEKGLLNNSFKKPSKYLVDWPMIFKIILHGGIMTVVALAMFTQYYEVDLIKATTITLTVLSILQWYNIFNIRSDEQTVFSRSLFNNKYLIFSLLLTVILHLFAIYHPFMQKILHTTGLSINEWIFMLVVGFSIVIVEEIRKKFYRIGLRKIEIIKTQIS